MDTEHLECPTSGKQFNPARSTKESGQGKAVAPDSSEDPLMAFNASRGD